MIRQANILIENRPGVVSLWLIWDLWSLTNTGRGICVRRKVEAAFDPARERRFSVPDRNPNTAVKSRHYGCWSPAAQHRRQMS
jgi:hypothetical protein